MELSLAVQQWRQEAYVRQNNATAERLLAQVDPETLKTELRYHLAGLYNNEGANILQPQRVEGPEHLHILLHMIEVMKRTKARIRAITLDAYDYVKTAGRLKDRIEKTMQFSPMYYELKTAEMRKTAVAMVCRELVELEDEWSPVVHMGTEIGKEYSDQFNAVVAAYNVVNAMSYQRGLYGTGTAPAPANTPIRR